MTFIRGEIGNFAHNLRNIAFFEFFDRSYCLPIFTRHIAIGSPSIQKIVVIPTIYFFRFPPLTFFVVKKFFFLNTSRSSVFVGKRKIKRVLSYDFSVLINKTIIRQMFFSAIYTEKMGAGKVFIN